MNERGSVGSWSIAGERIAYALTTPRAPADLFVSEKGDTFVSGPWTTPGTFHITCQLHPEMNITVIVTE